MLHTPIPVPVTEYRPTNAPASSWRRAQCLADLALIHETDVNLVWLPRSLDPRLRDEVAALVADWPGEQREVHSYRPGHALRPLTGLAAPCLREDVARLLEMFADLLGAARVGLGLDTLRHAMCPRFHTDRVLLRLLCTYLGAGTEWLADDAVDRTRLGHRADGMSDDASGAICGPVRKVPVGAIALLKGDAWPGSDERGCVHRSPSASSDAPRLVLTLDVLG